MSSPHSPCDMVVNHLLAWDIWQDFPPPPPSFSHRFVNILLPPDAKEIATRFRWWQPRHDGPDQNDWAIDNVLISGSAYQRTVMLDTFSSAPVPQHERSPADAGPVGRIAFDMFMEDKTAGKFFITLNKNPVEMQFRFGSLQENGMWNLLHILNWYRNSESEGSPFCFSHPC